MIKIKTLLFKFNWSNLIHYLFLSAWKSTKITHSFLWDCFTFLNQIIQYKTIINGWIFSSKFCLFLCKHIVINVPVLQFISLIVCINVGQNVNQANWSIILWLAAITFFCILGSLCLCSSLWELTWGVNIINTLNQNRLPPKKISF